MVRPSKLVALALAALLASAAASGLEVQRGKLKLVVQERTGRFTLWGSEDTIKPVWSPLFSSDDPSTSRWKLAVGDKYVNLGDDAGFPAAVEQTPTGAKVTWTGKALVATLTFDFVLSQAAAVADGLKLDLSVVNVSDTAAKVGVRWILDTNLGEKKEHFHLSTGETLVSETKVEGSLPEWWSSKSLTADAPGLLVMAGKTSTPPNRILFANWKRLDDAPWDPVYKQGRDFNLLPYSFNDSAAASYYDPQDLAPGATRELVVILGLTSAQTLFGARLGSANPLDDLLKKDQDPSRGVLDQDLASLDTLVEQIDAKLADPSKVSPEDLKLLGAVLDQLDARRKTLTAPVATTP